VDDKERLISTLEKKGLWIDICDGRVRIFATRRRDGTYNVWDKDSNLGIVIRDCYFQNLQDMIQYMESRAPLDEWETLG